MENFKEELKSHRYVKDISSEFEYGGNVYFSVLGDDYASISGFVDGDYCALSFRGDTAECCPTTDLSREEVVNMLRGVYFKGVLTVSEVMYVKKTIDFNK